MERGTFPRILDAFDDFVVVKLNTSGSPNAEFNSELQHRLVGENSLPRYVVLDPYTEKVLRDWAFEVNFKSDPQTFVKYLEEGKRVFDTLRGN